MRFQTRDEIKGEPREGKAAQLVKAASLRAEIYEFKLLVSAIDARIALLGSEIEALNELRREKQDFPSYRDINVKRHLVVALRALSKSMVARISEARAGIGEDR